MTTCLTRERAAVPGGMGDLPAEGDHKREVDLSSGRPLATWPVDCDGRGVARRDRLSREVGVYEVE